MIVDTLKWSFPEIPMTDNDRQLIEEAEKLSRFDYEQINKLLEKADSLECATRLGYLYNDLYDLSHDEIYDEY